MQCLNLTSPFVGVLGFRVTLNLGRQLSYVSPNFRLSCDAQIQPHTRCRMILSSAISRFKLNQVSVTSMMHEDLPLVSNR